MRTPVIVGPHNVDVFSVLVGCLFGDAYANQTKGKIVGTHLCFKQSNRHKYYLFFFFEKGYCTASGPREYKTIHKGVSGKSKIYFGYEFDTFTFSSLNWLYDLFYMNDIKIILSELLKYLTPVSLAYLIKDNGG